jgi:hypothetical protein
MPTLSPFDRRARLARLQIDDALQFRRPAPLTGQQPPVGAAPQAPQPQPPQQPQPLQQAMQNPQQPGVNLQVVVPGQQPQTNPLAQLSAKYGQPAGQPPAAPAQAPAPQAQPLAAQPKAFAFGGLAVKPRRKARTTKGA